MRFRLRLPLRGPLGPTIRLRLTLVYGGLFLAAGAALLAVNYALVNKGLHDQVGGIAVPVEGTVVGEVVAGPGVVPFEGPSPGLPRVFLDAAGRPAIDVIRRYEADVRSQALHQLLVQSSIGLGVMALVSVGLGWVVAGRMLRPLQQITAAARQLSQANLHQRLALEGPADELKELADTFDDMLGRLEAAFETQRRFVANASHELRTPLAIQRTLVDVALADPESTPDDLRRMAAAVRDAVDRSEKLIDGLLVLARSEEGPVATEPVDLALAADAAVQQVADEAAAAGMHVETRLDAAPTAGSRILLERLVGNLVQNAVRHNVPDGWVAVETGLRDGRAALTVRNGGPVVAPEHVAGLFEPFRRLSPDRVGSARGVGLGLSIVRAVATAHRGTVEAAPGASGGLVVTVLLPAGHPAQQPVQDPAVVGRQDGGGGHLGADRAAVVVRQQ